MSPLTITVNGTTLNEEQWKVLRVCIAYFYCSSTELIQKCMADGSNESVFRYYRIFCHELLEVIDGFQHVSSIAATMAGAHGVQLFLGGVLIKPQHSDMIRMVLSGNDATPIFPGENDPDSIRFYEVQADLQMLVMRSSFG